jgi:hypothetical protein
MFLLHLRLCQQTRSTMVLLNRPTKTEYVGQAEIARVRPVDPARNRHLYRDLVGYRPFPQERGQLLRNDFPVASR